VAAVFYHACATTWILSAVLSAFALTGPATAATAVGVDRRLSYPCPLDGSPQDYRLYIPSGHQPGQPIPLVVALHGSGGNENSFFDDTAHYPARDGLKAAAEQYNVLAVCPSARGNTNYRGLGAVAVFRVIAEVQRLYRVDPDRIYLTGHSMGGTGATDLALHHPGVFAAVAPIAAARSIRWVAANAQHTPFWWIGGERDQAYYKLGVAVGYERMRQLGYPARLTELAGEDHYGAARDFRPIIAWLLQHRRVAPPKEFVFEVDTALHPQAHWITVERLAQAGRIGVVRTRATSPQQADVTLEHVERVAVWRDPAVFAAEGAFTVSVAGRRVFEGPVSPTEAVMLTRRGNDWTSEVQARRIVDPTEYRCHPVAEAPFPLDHSGTESTLGNWIADAMRAATGAEVALYNHRLTPPDRPIPAGTVDIVDLLQCSLPGDQDLVLVELTGAEIGEILDANIPAQLREPGDAANLLVQISGGRYTFDRRLAPGRRIVNSDLDVNRRYRVALEGQVIERETMRLAGRFKRLDFRSTDVPFTLALYGHAARTGEITGRREGRVVEIR